MANKIPRRRLKVCKRPGCKNVSYETYCKEHKFEPRYIRDPEAKRFYDSRIWRQTRAAKITKTPYCEDCKDEGKDAPAQDVDHVIPRKKRPDLALRQSNLRSLCKSHHSKKTRAGG